MTTCGKIVKVGPTISGSFLFCVFVIVQKDLNAVIATRSDRRNMSGSLLRPQEPRDDVWQDQQVIWVIFK